MFKSYHQVIPAALLLAVLVTGCARVGRPSGGPKDMNPPVYVASTPENRTKNFTGDRITIEFDEYIQLKDQSREIIVSPPMKEKPLLRVRDKSIVVSLNEDLLPQTTYTINFGNSLADFNEGNILPDFDFVFSTGSVIDSLSVTGRVVRAFDHEPEDIKESAFLVMLYTNLSDSAPLLEIPRFYGKTNKDGLFAVNNLPPDTFRIIALKDANNNLMYDPALDNIAFMDSLLVLNSGNVISQTYIRDTIKIITPAVRQGRSGRQEKEPAVADTTIAPGKLVHALNISLLSFTEENSQVFISSRNREASERFSVIFNRPPFDTLKLTPLNFSPGKDWYLKEVSRNNDSIIYWIADTNIVKMDTLRLKLSYLTTDSAGRFMQRNDTVVFRYSSSTGRSERGSTGRALRKAEKEVRKETLAIKAGISDRGLQHLHESLRFSAEKPLQSINPDSIELYRKVDTLFVKQTFVCTRDTSSVRAFRVESKWEEDSPYRILLKPGAAVDIYG
ncbi:MAG: Ig-like domain-containing protein, partial [Bacteroidales bacterium]|nr:Ig-like domain-containing protein [Bacteroidales bacterium]